MPSKTEKQRTWIFTQRGKYKSKDNTPEDMKWIWKSDWEKVEEVRLKRYKSKYIERFSEELRLSDLKKQFSEALRLRDLMKSASMSDFTKDYSKETNKLMGPPTTHIKLTKMKVNKSKDFVIFIFKTKRTPKYDAKQKMVAVDPATFKTKPANLYTIEIKILDFFKLLYTKEDENFTNKDIEEVLNEADIQIWSSVPAFQFQGMNYNMTLFDASIYPENRPPEIWNDVVSKYGKTHNENQFLDKHTAGVINSIKFYIPQMRMMLKKYLGLTKK